MRIQHVYPSKDAQPHVVNGEPCWCQPQVNEEGITGTKRVKKGAPITIKVKDKKGKERSKKAKRPDEISHVNRKHLAETWIHKPKWPCRTREDMRKLSIQKTEVEV